MCTVIVPVQYITMSSISPTCPLPSTLSSVRSPHPSPSPFFSLSRSLLNPKLHAGGDIARAWHAQMPHEKDVPHDKWDQPVGTPEAQVSSFIKI